MAQGGLMGTCWLQLAVAYRPCNPVPPAVLVRVCAATHKGLWGGKAHACPPAAGVRRVFLPAVMWQACQCVCKNQGCELTQQQSIMPRLLHGTQTVATGSVYPVSSEAKAGGSCWSHLDCDCCWGGAVIRCSPALLWYAMLSDSQCHALWGIVGWRAQAQADSSLVLSATYLA